MAASIEVTRAAKYVPAPCLNNYSILSASQGFLNNFCCKIHCGAGIVRFNYCISSNLNFHSTIT